MDLMAQEDEPRVVPLGQKRRGIRAEPVFSPAERRIFEVLARTALPSGGLLPGGDAGSVERLERWVIESAPALAPGIRALLWTMELGAVPLMGSRFTQLGEEARLRYLEAGNESDLAIRRAGLRALLMPLKAAHFDTPEMHQLVGCRYAVDPP